ncbi:MAG: hypothetical protein QM731_05780 [Chitinophagaceae bacterium]
MFSSGLVLHIIQSSTVFLLPIMQYKDANINLSGLAIGVGILILFSSYFIDKNDRYYTGTPLTAAKIKITHPPKYVSGSKIPARWQFSGEPLYCTFWLSEGALKIIYANDSVKQIIADLKAGDLVEVYYREEEDEKELMNPLNNIRAIGLSWQSKLLISPSAVKDNEHQSYRKGVWLGLSVLLLGIAGLLYKRFKRKRQPEGFEV